MVAAVPEEESGGFLTFLRVNRIISDVDCVVSGIAGWSVGGAGTGASGVGFTAGTVVALLSGVEDEDGTCG